LIDTFFYNSILSVAIVANKTSMDNSAINYYAKLTHRLQLIRKNSSPFSI